MTQTATALTLISAGRLISIRVGENAVSIPGENSPSYQESGKRSRYGLRVLEAELTGWDEKLTARG